jgi:hypothetical protein
VRSLELTRILDSIRTAIRRKDLDLISKATNLIETSVTITNASISVKGGRSTGPDTQAQGLHVAFDVIEKLSPSNKSGLHKSLRGLDGKVGCYRYSTCARRSKDWSLSPVDLF